MKNWAIGQFTGNMHQIFAYLVTTYQKRSPSLMNNFEKEVTEMHYDLITPVHIIKKNMTYATKAELAALYIMAREAVYMRIIVEEMGHKQPPTPLQIDNVMAGAVTNSKV